ncbi:MAG TPA: glycosyltransferase family 39 protein [Candidatus Paceibacterota bacterium]
MIAYIKECPVLSIFILAVCIRVFLLFLFPLPDYAGGDFSLYHRITTSIIANGNFGGEPQATYGSPSINPGWSFFLAGLYFLFGDSQTILLIFSIVLGGLLAIGAYFLSMCFFNKEVSFLAGLMVSLWPVFLIQTFIYTDSLLLYTVLLLWGAFFFSRVVLHGYYLSAVASGFLLGFAILTDSIAFFIPIAFLLWLFVERPSLVSLGYGGLFLGACLLILTPWIYRNIIVAEELGLEHAPAISKDEMRLASPAMLLTISTLVAKDGVLISGLSQAFVFPFNISILDQGTDLYYKDIMIRTLRGEYPALSHREIVIMGVKVAVTALHWLLLALSVTAFFFICGGKTKRFFLFALLLVLYVVGASIGFGSLWENDFKGISALSSFLFPLIPLLIIFASFSIMYLVSSRAGREDLFLEKDVYLNEGDT